MPNHPYQLDPFFKMFLEKLNVRGMPLIVACSGGGDSVALAYLACKYHQGNLFLAYVQHQLRGDESQADEGFLKQFVNELSSRHQRSIGLHILDGRLTELKGRGIEAAARAVRRKELAGLAERIGSGTVLMGHNLNDQVETFLMRLVRGAGPMALGGIKPRAVLSEGVFVHRPLLQFDREFLRKYLVSERLAWREDSSNQSCRFTRNFIRLKLIEPLVMQFGKRVLQRVSNHAKWTTRQAETQLEEINLTLSRLELPKAGPKVVLSKALVEKMAVRKLSDIFHFIWKRENWPSKDLTRAHLLGMARFILRNNPMGELPGRIQIRMDAHVVCMGPEFPPMLPKIT